MTSCRIFGVAVEAEPSLETPTRTTAAARSDEGEGLGVSVRLERMGVTPEEELASISCLYSSGRLIRGIPAFRLYRLQGQTGEQVRYLFRLGEVAEFVLSDDRILGRTLEEPWQPSLELALLGKVLALWNESRGRPVLHAATLSVDELGIGFLGFGGSGKSTWAMAMIGAGARLLSDDLLTLQRWNSQEWAAVGLPSLRVWPRHLDRVIEAWPQSWVADLKTRGRKTSNVVTRIHPEVEKWRLLVPREFLASSGVALRHLMILDRVESETELTIEPVPRRQAVGAVLAHSFVPRLASAVRGEAERLERLAALVTTVPVSRLRYPSGLEKMPEAARTICRFVSDS